MSRDKQRGGSIANEGECGRGIDWTERDGEFPRYIFERFCNAITTSKDRTQINYDRKQKYLWRIRTED